MDPLLLANLQLQRNEVTLVVLDPGHGGRDPGTVGPGYVPEKKIVLDIAKRTQRRLEGSGITVRLTRDHDTDLSLVQRSALARRWGADLFVSIHLNSARNQSASGIESYILPPAGSPSTSGNQYDSTKLLGHQFEAQSLVLAYWLQRSLVFSTGLPDRGVRRARFAVLTPLPCPGVLVECGFLSNPIDAQQISRRNYKDTVAEALARGILTFVSWACEQ
ncbi:MAG: N-acetylmuramoyl-L-alanine amidase family protein [Kiritimatiellia bacterium]